MKPKYNILSLKHSQKAEYLYFLINDEDTNSVSVDVNKACVVFDKPAAKEGFLYVPIDLLEKLDREITVFEQGDQVVFNTPENLDKLGLKEEEGVLMRAQQYYVLSTEDTDSGEERLYFFIKDYREEDESVCRDLEQAFLTTSYEEDAKHLYLEKEKVDAVAVYEEMKGTRVENTVKNRAALGLEYDEDVDLVRVKEKQEEEPEAPKEKPVSIVGIGLQILNLGINIKKAYEQSKPAAPKSSYTNINDLADQIHQVNREKGFWDKKRNVGEMLMLVTSELGEAMEAHRKGKFADWKGYNFVTKPLGGTKVLKVAFEEHIKDSFEDELADAIIRLLDMAAGLNIDLNKHIKAKLDYNRSRARFHGKKY